MSPIKDDSPQALSALREKAQDFLKRSYLKEAQEAFDAVLELDPDSVVDLVCRGMASIKLKQWKKAEADFLKAKTLDPADQEAWLGLAVSTASLQRIPEAMEIFEAMLAMHPGFVRGHIQAARFYYQLVAVNKGKEHLDAALAGRPSPEQRREVEAIRLEQAELDKKRMYRPDFAALNRPKDAKAGA